MKRVVGRSTVVDAEAVWSGEARRPNVGRAFLRTAAFKRLLDRYSVAERPLKRAAAKIDRPTLPFAAADPTVLESADVTVPVTVGALSPKVLLPSSWREWPGSTVERQRSSTWIGWRK
jgi:hypothetical protein